MSETKEQNYFRELYDIDLSDKVEQKNGKDYLAWSIAWAELKKKHPNATFTVRRFGEQQLPYIYDENLGYMVFTSVTVDDVTHEMHLPVLDGANKAMKAHPYTYQTKSGEKTVEAATMYDINTAIMRCLTKNIALHGIGLFVYNGEESPESVRELTQLRKECTALIKSKSELGEDVLKTVAAVCKETAPQENGDPKLIESIETLQTLKKKLLAIRKPRTK